MQSHKKSIPVHPTIKRSSLFFFILLCIIVLGSLLSIAATEQGSFVLGSTYSKNAADSSRMIDKYIADGWKNEDLKPSNQSSDEEFIRRVTIDIIGQIPTANQVSDFLLDKNPNKRQLKIDELLSSNLYGDNWANIWTKWLVGREFKLGQVKPREIKDWLSVTFNKNTPYDEFVTSLISAEGNTMENPAAYYIVRYEAKPEDLAGNVSRLFMGKQIQCAQCHKHPYEPIKQEDFWAMAAFFSRTKLQEIREDKKIIGTEVYDRPRGDVYIPNKEPRTPIQPKFITGEKIDNGFMTKRRVELAKLITSPGNPYFAKAIVNRIWDHFMGRGIIEPVDNIEGSATHQELLDFLAKDFVARNYDLKYLIRAITNTKTYQLSSHANSSNDKDTKFYTHAYLRPLSAEQLFYSLLQSTGLEEVRKNFNPEQLDRMKEGYLRRFVFIFDNDEMEEDESFQGTIPQALMLLNGQLVNEGVRSIPGSTMNTIMRNARTDSERIDWLYLATLSRYPLAEEKKYCIEYLNKNSNNRAENRGVSLYAAVNNPGQVAPKDRQNNGQQYDRFLQRMGNGRTVNPAYEDIFWALLNSPEFIFNH